MAKDGKNKFFKKLNLDEETKKTIKFYRKIRNAIDKEPERSSDREAY